MNERTASPAPVTFRPARLADLPAVLVINQANVPEVGPTTLERLERFLAMAELFEVAVGADDRPMAFVIVLAEGCDYDSPNYAWFVDRHERFLYVDRIAVDAGHRNRGIARRLYDDAVARVRDTGRHLLCAEVNVEPRNDVSLAFHHGYGFVAQAEVADPRYPALRVAMLTRTVEQR